MTSITRHQTCSVEKGVYHVKQRVEQRRLVPHSEHLAPKAETQGKHTIDNGSIVVKIERHAIPGPITETCASDAFTTAQQINSPLSRPDAGYQTDESAFECLAPQKASQLYQDKYHWANSSCLATVRRVIRSSSTTDLKRGVTPFP